MIIIFLGLILRIIISTLNVEFDLFIDQIDYPSFMNRFDYSFYLKNKDIIPLEHKSN